MYEIVFKDSEWNTEIELKQKHPFEIEFDQTMKIEIY